MVSNPPGAHGAQGRWVEERRVKRDPWDPGPLQPQQLYWVCVLSVELKQQTALLTSTTLFFQIPTSSLKLANKSTEIRWGGGGVPLPQGLMPGLLPTPNLALARLASFQWEQGGGPAFSKALSILLQGCRLWEWKLNYRRTQFSVLLNLWTQIHSPSRNFIR